MVDWSKDTGSSGEMVIRDNGSTVSFLINAHNGSTFNHDLPWGYTVNGTTNNSRQIDYGAGDGWVTLGSWTVTTDQTVTFRLFDTNTSGFGGPTTFSHAIDRASAPNAPARPTISEITASSMRIRFASGDNNGSAIDFRQVARNTSNTLSGAAILGADGDNVYGGLAGGTTYYWWARTHNSKGYSPWSSSASAKTIRVADAPDQVITSDPTQTSFTASFTDNGNGGSTIVERQIVYNTTNTTAGASSVGYAGVMVVTGLQPATTYYVWARIRNAAGWSPYSPVTTQRTVAGAWFNVANQWREAVPYVKTSGVWKLARPWGRDAGVWKETS